MFLEFFVLIKFCAKFRIVFSRGAFNDQSIRLPDEYAICIEFHATRTPIICENTKHTFFYDWKDNAQIEERERKRQIKTHVNQWNAWNIKQLEWGTWYMPPSMPSLLLWIELNQKLSRLLLPYSSLSRYFSAHSMMMMMMSKRIKKISLDKQD